MAIPSLWPWAIGAAVVAAITMVVQLCVHHAYREVYVSPFKVLASQQARQRAPWVMQRLHNVWLAAFVMVLIIWMVYLFAGPSKAPSWFLPGAAVCLTLLGIWWQGYAITVRFMAHAACHRVVAGEQIADRPLLTILLSQYVMDPIPGPDGCLTITVANPTAAIHHNQLAVSAAVMPAQLTVAIEERQYTLELYDVRDLAAAVYTLPPHHVSHHARMMSVIAASPTPDGFPYMTVAVAWTPQLKYPHS